MQTQDWRLTKVGDWDNTTINGVPQVRDHNPVHELTQINGAALTYDLKGNLTLDANGQSYTWDFDNQMAITDVLDADTLDYTYDALGRRVSKSVTDDDTTTTTIFVCDGAQVIAEYAGAVLLRKYVYATYIDDVCLMVRASDGAKFFYRGDSIYNTRVITDNPGAIVETYSYTPYGKAEIRDANDLIIADSLVGNPMRFQAGYHDFETGLDCKRVRYYDGELGRFVGRDPYTVGKCSLIRGPSRRRAGESARTAGAWLVIERISTPLGIWHDTINLGNGYGYIGNSPPNYMDPFGLWPAGAASEVGQYITRMRNLTNPRNTEGMTQEEICRELYHYWNIVQNLIDRHTIQYGDDDDTSHYEASLYGLPLPDCDPPPEAGSGPSVGRALALEMKYYTAGFIMLPPVAFLGVGIASMIIEGTKPGCPGPCNDCPTVQSVKGAPCFPIHQDEETCLCTYWCDDGSFQTTPAGRAPPLQR